MANRSNRRRKNPGMSTCEKHDKAIGSRRANSPLWPCIEASMRQTRPDIRKQSNLPVIDWNACKPRRSPYTAIRLRDGCRRNCPMDCRSPSTRRTAATCCGHAAIGANGPSSTNCSHKHSLCPARTGSQKHSSFRTRPQAELMVSENRDRISK